MKYKVVCCTDKEFMTVAVKKLENEVNILCQAGWKVQGGISIAIRSGNLCCACQAMVKN